MDIPKVKQEIMNHHSNKRFTQKGWKPLFSASEKSKIVVIGQAPGKKAQESGTPWGDVSGKNLRQWLGVDDTTFYNADNFALLPMDFYYPGKAQHGDKPPRKDFAQQWHGCLIDNMPQVELTLLIGQYAQQYYLGAKAKRNLTETVRAYEEYLPQFFPLVHPSPLNFRWRSKNPWFEQEVLKVLREKVQNILK